MRWIGWIARYVLLPIVLLPLAIINVEKLAQDKHWDNALVSVVAAMPDMTALFGNVWFVYFLGSLVGVAAYFWIDFFSSKARLPIKTRPQWEAELPLSEIFKPGNEIHALFLTGEGIFTRHIEYARYIKRLILPSHDASYLALVEAGRRAAGHQIDLGAQIRNYGQAVKLKGVEVRYLSDHIGISFLICNPDKSDAWMHIGFSTPFIEADTQPILRIDKSNSAELYGIFWHAYTKLWEMGREQIIGSAIQEVLIDEPERKATLRIKSDPESGDALGRYMRFEEDGNLRAWYLEIVNESPDIDAVDVEVKVESYDPINDLLNPRRITDCLTRVGKALAFERGGNTRTIRGSDSEWMKFIQYANPPRMYLQLGEYTPHTFDLHDKIATVHTPHRIDISVRAVNASTVTAKFFVVVENDMLTVKML